MKKTRKELKISARASLLGHYKTVITALLFSQLAALLLNIPFQRMAQQGILYMVPSRIALGVLGSILVFLLSSLLQIGVSQIHLQIARKQETRLEHLFFAFRNNPDRFLGYSAVLLAAGLICMFPGVLLLMLPSSGDTAVLLALTGGIVTAAGSVVLIVLLLSWALTPFLMLDHPELRVREALRNSRQLMRGQKSRLFILELSFLGWILFSAFSMGIALLWVLPYMTQTLVWFYLELVPQTKEEVADDSVH